MTIMATILKPMVPLFIGAALAFVLNIYMKVLEKLFHKMKSRKLRRAVSLVLTFLSLFLIIALVLFIVIPEIAKTFENLASMLPGFMEDATAWLNDMLVRFPMVDE